VTADVTADEVIVAGEYAGKMTCARALEVRSTGRLRAASKTVKMMLHEGGIIDGELHMIRPGEEESPATRSRAGVRSGAADSGIRQAVRTRSRTDRRNARRRISRLPLGIRPECVYTPLPHRAGATTQDLGPSPRDRSGSGERPSQPAAADRLSVAAHRGGDAAGCHLGRSSRPSSRRHGDVARS